MFSPAGLTVHSMLYWWLFCSEHRTLSPWRGCYQCTKALTALTIKYFSPCLSYVIRKSVSSPVSGPALGCWSPGWAQWMCIVACLQPVFVPVLLGGLWTHVVALSMVLSPFAPGSLFRPWICFVACLVWDCWLSLLPPSSSGHHVQMGHSHPPVKALPKLRSHSDPGSTSLREQPALAAPWQLLCNPQKFKLSFNFLCLYPAHKKTEKD